MYFDVWQLIGNILQILSKILLRIVLMEFYIRIVQEQKILAEKVNNANLTWNRIRQNDRG